MGNSAAGRLTSTYFGAAATTLGLTGGADHTSTTLGKQNLPNYALDLSGASVTVFANDLTGQRGTNAGNLVSSLSNGGGGGTENATYPFNGTIPLGGSGTPVAISSLPPMMLATYYLKL
jgi:hypothetical protein